jgi:hypothetical protein
MTPREIKQSFRLDNSISWGDLGMAISLLIAGVVAIAEIDGRVSMQNERINHVATGTNSLHSEFMKHTDAERQAREDVRMELRAELKDINLKLDKLIEREIDRTR